MYPELKSRLATIAEANMNRVIKVRSRTDSIYAHAPAQLLLNHLGAFCLNCQGGYIGVTASCLSNGSRAPRRQRDL